jgi:YesN/AraC family two-component response regulator
MIKMNLLIADDEEELIENLEYDLKKVVSRVIVAKNGAEALIKLKENKVDCVMTDINMPQKNGLQFAKEAREWGFELPIIFLTAHGDDELRKKALNLNAFDFIDKPYTKETLVEILKEAYCVSISLQSDLLHDDNVDDSEFKKSYISMLKNEKDSL